MIRNVFIFCCVLFFSSLAITSQGAGQGEQDFERHTVRYSTFNSTFVLPEIARAYNIKRSKYESLLNVSVSELGQYGSMPARVEGTVTNLIQQQKMLTFQEIIEQNATYYLAPLRIAGEETVHIELFVTPKGEDQPLRVKFTTKVYQD